MPLSRVVFDHGPLGTGTSFELPSKVIMANEIQEVKPAFEEMQRAKDQGHWLAGLASYELGYAFSNKLQKLMPKQRQLPLLAFGVFEGADLVEDAPQKEGSQLSPLQPVWQFAQYHHAFKQVNEYIRAGDIYQANLTFPLDAGFSGTPEGLYAQLRQKQAAPHGAFVDLGEIQLLSRSPELFFEVDEKNSIQAKPMKGTAARGVTEAEDRAQIEWLRNSEKNQAENLMIVDLMRNDMSRISKIGSVKVPELFHIETYATLHQMTSRICADLLEDLSLYDIFAALFPCGSITGAPKIRAMQIISELESGAREAYCGSIGWIAPDGRMSMNVAIRTLMCQQNAKGQGLARLNVGGGLVYDSTAQEEYDEALLKAKFAE